MMWQSCARSLRYQPLRSQPFQPKALTRQSRSTPVFRDNLANIAHLDSLRLPETLWQEDSSANVCLYSSALYYTRDPIAAHIQINVEHLSSDNHLKRNPHQQNSSAFHLTRISLCFMYLTSYFTKLRGIRLPWYIHLIYTFDIHIWRYSLIRKQLINVSTSADPIGSKGATQHYE